MVARASAEVIVIHLAAEGASHDLVEVTPRVVVPLEEMRSATCLGEHVVVGAHVVKPLMEMQLAPRLQGLHARSMEETLLYQLSQHHLFGWAHHCLQVVVVLQLQAVKLFQEWGLF